MIRIQFAALTALALILLAGTDRACAQETTRERDVVYGRKFGMALTMDVWKPAKQNGIGVIFLVSGGFKSGMDLVDSASFGSVVLKPFLDRGQTVFAVSHSAQPKFNVTEILPDIHRAVRFIRVHAKDHGVDPDRLGIMGTSSGGFLALSIATAGKPGDPAAKGPVDRASSRVQAVACFCPGADLINYGEGRSVVERDPVKAAGMFGVQDKPKEEQLRMLQELSPLGAVTKDTAPTLIIHGDSDQAVPYEQSERFVTKLAEYQVPHQLITRKNAGHSWPDMRKDDALRADWFDKHLHPTVADPSPMLRATPTDGSDVKGVDFFESKVRPLLSNHCYQCHSRQSQNVKGELLVDSPEGLLKGGDSGELFVPGDPDKSLLIKAVRYKDEDLRMPPDGKKLTEAQIADLEAWVKMGASLPRTEVREDKIKASARTHWAFQPVKHPAVPKVKNQRWVQSPVDAFILAKLEAAGIEPSAPADKHLVRRATYDLIGLPPTPAEVANFIADKSPNAFATVVDRLLDSQHYGERWGRHWLDVARYATTDSPYAFTYRDYVIRAFNEDLPYDEFLLQQLAADQLELGKNKQALAGLGFLTVGRQFMNNHDTIDDRIDVVTRGTMALSVSCARCHDHKYDPIPTKDYYGLHGVFANSVAPSEMPLLDIAPDPTAHAEYLEKRKPLQAKLDDFIRKQEADVLKQHRGQTAKCLLLSREQAKLAELIKEEFGLSDRKILQAGATRWLKWLETLDKESDPIFAPWFAFAALPPAEFSDRAKTLSANIAANSLVHPVNSLVAQAFAGEVPTSLTDVAERYGKLFEDADKQWQEMQSEADQDTNSASAQTLPKGEQEALRQVFYGKDSPGNLPAELMRQLFPTSALMQLGPLSAEVSGLEADHPGAPLRAMALVDRPQPTNSRVFIRGNPNRLGEEVPRQFLAILAGDKREPFTHGSGRLELARAIANRENPLTARVMVNRLWLHHFGAGLVTTPDDFGLRSDPPSHPELLDYLAWKFMQDGWSLKKLHRLLMLSSVYQQQSDDNLRHETLDPDNRLLAKMNRRRLDFESMRDTLLSVAGKLDRTLGGRPVALQQQMNPKGSSGSGTGSQGPYSNRRTVYGVIDRNDLLPLFRIFDFANPDISTAQRDVTTVPQQALFFFNNPFVMQQACSLAARADFQLFDETAKRVRYVYQQVLQRDPTAGEIELANRFLAAEESAASSRAENSAADSSARSGLRPLRPWERFVHVLLMSDELLFID